MQDPRSLALYIVQDWLGETLDLDLRCCDLLVLVIEEEETRQEEIRTEWRIGYPQTGPPSWFATEAGYWISLFLSEEFRGDLPRARSRARESAVVLAALRIAQRSPF